MVNLHGELVKVHIPDPGRLEELLYESGMDLEVSWCKEKNGHIIASYKLRE